MVESKQHERERRQRRNARAPSVPLIASLAMSVTGVGVIFAISLSLAGAFGVASRSAMREHVELSRPLLPAAVQVSSPPARVETEVITIRPSGFEPSEVTRPKGLFALAVENRSGLEEVTLRLDREGGNRLHEARVPRVELNWKQGVDVAPGRYLLTEANHSEWTCVITVTEK